MMDVWYKVSIALLLRHISIKFNRADGNTSYFEATNQRGEEDWKILPYKDFCVCIIVFECRW